MFNTIRTIRIKDEHAANIIEQLMQMDAIEFMDSTNDFTLSEEQIALLDKRRLTPLENNISDTDSINHIKKKYGL